MPKHKTHRGLAKRVKITAGGKIKRRRAFTSHLMSGKSSSRRRHLRRATILTGKFATKFRKML